MRPTRRTPLLLAALALVFGSLLAFSTPAGAVEETEGACFTEAVKTAEDRFDEGSEEFDTFVEEEVSTCRQAPSPILPELNEIIYGAIGFAIVFFFMWRFGLPAMRSSMNARTEKIRGDIEAAETQRAEADTLLSDYKAQLADARNESARIIEESRQTADQLRRDLQVQAEADVAELRQRAAADIEAAKEQAIADLRGEVAAIAIGAAERVVERNLDAETNTALVESYINQVGATR